MRKCKATIAFGDDYGDNSSTFYCQLEKGHEGEHRETSDMGTSSYSIPYTLIWSGSSAEIERIREKEIKDIQKKCEHKNISGEGIYQWCDTCGKEFVKEEK